MAGPAAHPRYHDVDHTVYSSGTVTIVDRDGEEKHGFLASVRNHADLDGRQS
jgi:hypothetical protein